MIFAALLLMSPATNDPAVESHNCKSPELASYELRLVPEDIKRAEMSFHHQSNEPVINIEFSESGNERFTKVQIGRLGMPIALCLDGRLLSKPTLQEYVYGGFVQITGGFTVAEATDLAIKLDGDGKED